MPKVCRSELGLEDDRSTVHHYYTGAITGSDH